MAMHAFGALSARPSKSKSPDYGCVLSSWNESPHCPVEAYQLQCSEVIGMSLDQACMNIGQPYQLADRSNLNRTIRIGAIAI